MALTPGATHMLQWGHTEGREAAKRSESQKGPLSSDWSLQLDSMKSESLVTADQPSGGEYVPGPCTHRPSSQPSQVHPKRSTQPAKEGGGEGVPGEGD